MNPELLSAYRHHRRGHARDGNSRLFASLALTRARADVAADVKRYDSAFYPASFATPSCDASGLSWVEDTSAIGLRFVGHADAIAPRYVDHKGWYTDSEFQEETYRGGVWQLPARNGKSRYVAGYSDPHNDGAARLALGDIFEGERGDAGSDSSAAKEAAIRADNIARIEAEKERDYQDAWRAGNNAAEAHAEALEARQELLNVIRETKAAKAQEHAFPAIRAMVCRTVGGLLRTIRESREKRDSLVDNAPTWNADLRAAFADAYGRAI